MYWISLMKTNALLEHQIEKGDILQYRRRNRVQPTPSGTPFRQQPYTRAYIGIAAGWRA